MEIRRESLYRGLAEPPATRADTVEADGTTMFGHFAVFDTWTRIASVWEGEFVERVAPGAFKKSIAENVRSIKVQFDHGFDVNVGDAPLGPIDVLREDDQGAYYEVPLLDTDYNRDRVLPLLQGRLMNGEQRGSQLGASFRFRVTKDEWVDSPKASDQNPDRLPERTIREVQLHEFGPVVFPAYAEATAQVRCLTDHYLNRSLEPFRLRTTAQPEPSAAESTDDKGTGEPAPSHSTQPGGLLTAVALNNISRLRSPK